MTPPNIPNLPGFDAMADTLEFVKNMWGGTQVPGAMPGMVMPTLSIEEINKQVADLKAVEAWLAMNMNMLRTTIQALQVQAATLASLQAMGSSFGVHAKTDGTSQTASASAPTPEAWWDLLQQQFNQTVSSVMAEQASAQNNAKAPAAKSASTTAKKAPSRTTAKAGKKRAPPGKS